MKKYWLSNKKVSVQHCFVLRTEFNKCQILVALWAVKTCRQAAIMSWRKALQKEEFLFFPVALLLLRSIPEAELWISCSWAQPAGSHCNQQRETRVHLPLPHPEQSVFGIALNCVFPSWMHMPTEIPTRYSQLILKHGENTGKLLRALCRYRSFELLQLKAREKLLKKKYQTNSKLFLCSQSTRYLGVLGAEGLLQAVASTDITRNDCSHRLMVWSLSQSQCLGAGVAFGRLSKCIHALFVPRG